MSNVELHRSAHESMSTQGAEQAGAYFAPDAVYTDVARGLTLKGSDAITGWLAGWKTAFSDARVDRPTYLDAGDWTVARFQGRGVNDGPLGQFPPTRRQMDLAFCELCRWQGGKVVEAAIYYDSTTMLVQLGHAEPPPSP
jgi:hypothetical protein